MDSVRSKWNDRYASAHQRLDVDAHLATFVKNLEAGEALDIACGLGQNALFLRDLGWKVDAIDISDKAIEALAGEKNVTALRTDIADFSWPKESYDLILNINFLDRSIFSNMIAALRPGGYLFFKTFTYRSAMNPAYTLAKNELVKAFEALEIERYELLADGRALLIASKSHR